MMKRVFFLLLVLVIAVPVGVAIADDRPVKGEGCRPNCELPCTWRDCGKTCEDEDNDGSALDECYRCCSQRNWGDDLYERCRQRCREILGDPCDSQRVLSDSPGDHRLEGVRFSPFRTRAVT